MRLPVIFGLLALVCLFAGGWQVREHQAKAQRIDQARTALAAMPGALPDMPDPKADLFRAVRVAGTLTGDPVLKPVTHPQMGKGFRVLQGLDVDGRRILIDRGFIYDAWRDGPFVATTVEVNGNLDWPADLDDVAAGLSAAPLLVVAATPTGDGIIPMPVDTATLRGRHLRNALVWFALAGLFTIVTLLAQWRNKPRDEGNVTQ